MKIKLAAFFLLGLSIIAAAGLFPAAAQTSPATSVKITTQALNLFDKSRNRAVPVELYMPAGGADRAKAKKSKLKLAILSHGYGSQNTAYSFIADDLAKRGYLVASIQHELASDKPMPLTGNIYETRRPFWERGVQNILFVLEELKKPPWNLDDKNLLLIGHSNGGDTAMLFAAEHPGLVGKVITLDNRRMPFPRAARPRILSIRSSDQPADAGVLPTIREQKKFGIKIVKANIVHNDMWDGAAENQKQEILKFINDFL